MRYFTEMIWDNFGIFRVGRQFIKLAVLLSILAFVFITCTTEGQTKTTIYLDAGLQGMPSTLDEDNQYTIEIVEAANEELRESNIELVLTEAHWHDTSIHILGSARHRSVFFGVLGTSELLAPSAIETKLSGISSLIAYDFQPRTFWSILVDEAQNTTLPANFLVALTHYVLGDCTTFRMKIIDLQGLNTAADFQAYVHFLMGNCALVNGNDETALDYFETSLASVADIATRPLMGEGARQNLAWLLVRNGEIDAGLAIYSEVFNAEPTAAYVRIYQLSVRAQLYALAFDYDSAIGDMDTLIELAEGHSIEAEYFAQLYTQRGEIVLLIYEWDRALADFDQAIATAPEYAPAHYQRGILLYTMADREAALAAFERYLEFAPDGQYAELARSTIESIEIELDALGG